jgi:hypothetical protein
MKIVAFKSNLIFYNYINNNYIKLLITIIVLIKNKQH